jgi:alpha-methylacyl-CoA racemase
MNMLICARPEWTSLGVADRALDHHADGRKQGRTSRMPGPLTGVRVIELGGIGPAPFAGMMLADMGADVVRLHRTDVVERGVDPSGVPVLDRGRRSIGVDLKRADAVECVLRLAERADVVLEGFRPGVVERLGVGPEPCLQRNRQLVYGRMTGWGQDGPLADAAGHDINYIALAGVLAHIGRRNAPPTPPLNLVADFGGGGMLLAFGITCALFEAERFGEGQVVDAAMVDGAAVLMAMMWGLRTIGRFGGERGSNINDSGAPYYDAYETSDGEYVAIGAMEPKFYAELLERLGLAAEQLPHQGDREGWNLIRERLARVFAQHTRDEWCNKLEGTDVCFAPVLRMDEAATHPHIRERGTIVERDGLLQPAPAPRFSRTQPVLGRSMPVPGGDTDEVLTEWGFSSTEIAALHQSGAIRQGAGANVPA